NQTSATSGDSDCAERASGWCGSLKSVGITARFVDETLSFIESLRLREPNFERIIFMFKTVRAVRFLFIGPLILILLVIINVMTSPGTWWVQWAALGIGIAWAVSLI